MSTPRRVLVTGAASGIGRAIARAMAAQGDRVMLADRDAAVHDAAQALPGGPGFAEVADLADDAQAVALARRAVDRLGGIDVLVNNAGISPKRDGLPPDPAAIGLDEWERVLRVNLTAPFLLCRELLPGMLQRGHGRIVNIASRAGRTYVGPAGTHYAASKAGLIGMTRHLAGCCAARGVTVNAIAPGRVRTPLSDTSSPAVLEAAVAAIPAHRLGTPEEIAAAAVFLASDGAAYVTGVCLDVNGGAYMA